MQLDRRTAMLGSAAMALAGCTRAGPSRASTVPTPLTPADFSLVIDGLDHAEGVASAPDGRLFLSNSGGAIGVLAPGQPLRQVGAPLAANGVAVDARGRVIVANMGLLKQQPGPLQRINLETGTVETLVAELEGRKLVASNGPTTARDGSTYCTHSSWGPVANIGTTTPAGFIYMVRPDGSAAIVASDLRGVNGLCLDRDERHLYASLTAEGRIRRWRRNADGTLADPQDFGPQLGSVFPDQTVKAILALPPQEKAALGYCDGIAFDMADNLWITLPFSNRLVALTPQGRQIDILHDPAGEKIAMPTNLCWGGPDRRTLYVVSRGKGMIVQARTAIAGAPLANWPAG